MHPSLGSKHRLNDSEIWEHLSIYFPRLCLGCRLVPDQIDWKCTLIWVSATGSRLAEGEGQGFWSAMRRATTYQRPQMLEAWARFWRPIPHDSTHDSAHPNVFAIEHWTARRSLSLLGEKGWKWAPSTTLEQSCLTTPGKIMWWCFNIRPYGYRNSSGFLHSMTINAIWWPTPGDAIPQ